MYKRYGRGPNDSEARGRPCGVRADVSGPDLASNRQDFEDYRRQDVDSRKAERAETNKGVNLDESLEKDLFWTEPSVDGGVTEEALLAALSSVSAIGYEVPVSTKWYVELL